MEDGKILVVQCWARDSGDDFAVQHPAFISESSYAKCQEDIAVADEEELICIKWSSTGHITQVPRSHISLDLKPRARRRPRAYSPPLQQTTTTTTPNNKRKRSRQEKNSNSTTTTPSTRKKKGSKTSKSDIEIDNSPLSRFLQKGVNSSHNSSSPKRQQLLEQHGKEEKEAVAGPLSKFLVKGIDSTKKSTRDKMISSRRVKQDGNSSSDEDKKQKASIKPEPVHSSDMKEVKVEENNAYGYDTD